MTLRALVAAAYILGILGVVTGDSTGDQGTKGEVVVAVVAAVVDDKVKLGLEKKRKKI